MKRRLLAFTLVELLVVLAVIATLMLLVLAGVRSARGSAQSVACLSNLRQLAAANLAYAGEHGGQFAPAQSQDNLTRWHGVRGSVDGRFNPRLGPLAPYLGREGRVKLCPALADVLTGSASFEDGCGGYGYNAAYIGGTPLDPFQAERSVQIGRPVRTVMFTDTAFPRATGLQEYAYCEARQVEYPIGRFKGRLAASVHFRHAGLANVAWCDGHASAEAANEIDGTNGYGGNAAKWKIGWFGPPTENGYWRP